MSLKSRITSLSVVTILLVVAILETVNYLGASRSEQRIADAVLTGNSLIWAQLLEDEQSRIAGGIESFEQEFELRSAIKKSDAASVKEFADRYVNLTRDSGGYELLQIFDRDKQALYSSSADVSLAGIDTLLSAVVEDPRRHSGLLLASDSRVMAVLAFPSKGRRGLYGIGVYAKSLDSVLGRLAERSGFGVALSDLSGQLTADSGFPVVADIGGLLPEASQSSVDTVALEDQRFVLSILPVRDARGEVIANLLIARDDSERLLALERLTIGAQAFVVLSILVGVIGLFLALRHYLSPLQETAQAASRIAEGDLSVSLAARGVAEIGTLELAMNDMAERLRAIVGSIAGVTSQVRASARSTGEAVNETNHDVADEANKIEAIAVALDQMAGSINEVVQVTEQTAATGRMIEDEAEQGHQALQQNGEDTRRLVDEIDGVTGTIDGLNAHVEAVTGIVNVIKSVAEQTNLLALNAAIEAARAGEQGRGFAVVADEVRGLASRTHDSTREIETFIEQLQQGASDAVGRIVAARSRVHENATQTEAVLTRFEHIKDRIGELVSMGHDAASAVQEQSVVAREVADNMAMIREAADRTRQRSDALLATSRELDSHSATLESITGKFHGTGG
jgi:methyl-accepting chemotaxis protein